MRSIARIFCLGSLAVSAGLSAQPAPLWNATTTPRGHVVARPARGTPSVPVFGLSCANGAPLLLAQLTGRTAPNAGLTLATPARRLSLSLVRERDSGLYTVRLGDRAVIDLLSGAAHVDLIVDGHPAERLSLAGSRQAMDTALAACLPRPATAAAPATGFPPVPEGFYAVNATCAEAARDGMSYVYFTRTQWNEADGPGRIRRIAPAGGNAWRVTTTDGSDLTLTITGADSFTEYGRRFRHCPTAGVPAQARRDYGAGR